MLSQHDWFLDALRAVRSLGLARWCIGAGAIRNLIWDELSHNSAASGWTSCPSPLSDVDVAYFDSSDLSSQRDAALQALLHARLPGVPWEVTNQAGVHQWFAASFGHAVAPLASLEQAIATWPEYVTAVAVSLRDDDTMEVIAPFGLDDLFTMTVRHNPLRASVANYRDRLAKKRYAERWPGVTIVAAEC